MEQLGDAASVLGQPAAEYYREAQHVLLPAGAVWTDQESYARRMEAFERIQQKIYELDGAGRLRKACAPSPEQPDVEARLSTAPSLAAEPQSSADAGLSVWQFYPGLEIRVVQTFKDYDGQEVRADEVLHFAGSSYFFYDGGHTLTFAEKTIRLADVVEEHQAIIANSDNAWFQPLGR